MPITAYLWSQCCAALLVSISFPVTLPRLPVGGRMASNQPRQVIALTHRGKRQLLLRDCVSCSLLFFCAPHVSGPLPVHGSALNTICLGISDIERKCYCEPVNRKREIFSSIGSDVHNTFIQCNWILFPSTIFTILNCFFVFFLEMLHLLLDMLHCRLWCEDGVEVLRGFRFVYLLTAVQWRTLEQSKPLNSILA